jgi:hypothetical protein
MVIWISLWNSILFDFPRTMKSYHSELIMTGISLNYVKAIHGDEEDEAGMYVCHYQRRPLCRVLGALPSAEAKRRFAECHTRQMPSLPSVEHSTKRDTRQTSSLPRVTLGKKKNSGDVVVLAVTLCRVLAVSTRQRCSLCRVSILALGKVIFFIFGFKFFLWVL